MMITTSKQRGRCLSYHNVQSFLFMIAVFCAGAPSFGQQIAQGEPSQLLHLRLGMNHAQVDSASANLSADDRKVGCQHFQGYEFCYWLDNYVVQYTDSLATSIRLNGVGCRVFDYKNDDAAIADLRDWLSIVADGLTKKYGKPSRVQNRITGLNATSFWSSVNQEEGEFSVMEWKKNGVVVRLNTGVRSNGKAYVYRDGTDSESGYIDWLFYGVVTLEQQAVTNTGKQKRSK